MNACAAVVSGKALSQVRAHPRVVAIWITPASQDVDEALGIGHDIYSATTVPREIRSRLGRHLI